MRSDLVLQAALGEWQHYVRDPSASDKTPEAERGRKAIQRYIEEGLDWRLRSGYRGDGAFSWCGAFAAWCWGHAGMTPELAKQFAPKDLPAHPFASTYRLGRAAARDKAFALPRASDVLPGDVVCVLGESGKPFGDHIVLALAWDKSLAELICVHGNGHGRWPDGTWQEGVVVSSFPRTAIAAAYRPNEKWLAK